MATFTIGNFSGLTFADNGTVSQALQFYGYSGGVQSLSLSLGGLSHTYSDDLDMLLVAPNGTSNLLFWSDAGGSGDLNSDDYTFSDAGVAPLNDNGVIIGPLTPTAFEPGERDAQFGTATGGINEAGPSGGATFASAFNGTQVSGAWTLYVSDDSPGDTGSLDYWSLTI